MKKSCSGDVYTMNYKKSLIFFSLLLPSICFASSSYEEYKDAITICIDIEKSKDPLTVHDLYGMKPEYIERLLFIIKDVRIQQCSSEEEMRALIDELADNNKTVDAKEMGSRYLSIYNSRRMSDLSEAEKSSLSQLDISLRDKSLEVNLLDLREKLENR